MCHVVRRYLYTLRSGPPVSPVLTWLHTWLLKYCWPCSLCCILERLVTVHFLPFLLFPQCINFLFCCHKRSQTYCFERRTLINTAVRVACLGVTKVSAGLSGDPLSQPSPASGGCRRTWRPGRTSRGLCLLRHPLCDVVGYCSSQQVNCVQCVLCSRWDGKHFESPFSVSSLVPNRGGALSRYYENWVQFLY